MAEVVLSDVIVPEVYHKYEVENSTVKTRLFQSGIVVPSNKIATDLGGGGRTFQIPFWNDLGDGESNTSSDDSTSKSTAKKVGTGKHQFIRINRNDSWAAMDLVENMAGDDPIKHMTSRTGAYWERQYQKMLIAIMNGIIADNVASDGGDMVHDVSNDLAGAPTSTELMNAKNLIGGLATSGDQMDDYQAMAVHSMVYAQMNENDLISFERDSNGKFIKRFFDLEVIVDDGMPAVAGTNRITYTTALFKKGAFGHGEGNPKKAIAVERDESAGDGGGMETLFSRRELGMHPMGFTWEDAACLKESPTNAELANASNWSRAVDRKKIGMAFVKTNG